MRGRPDVVVDGDVCVTTRVVAMLISRGPSEGQDNNLWPFT